MAHIRKHPVTGRSQVRWRDPKGVERSKTFAPAFRSVSTPRYPESMRRMEEFLVLDGDDTLWVVEPLYDRARSAVAEFLANLELDPTEWEAMQRRIDLDNVAILGLSSERFPKSCVEAYLELQKKHGNPPVSEVIAKIRALARTVFNEKAPLVSGVHDVLSTLRSQGYRLALLTQGETWVQEKRIADSGLGKFFQICSIVNLKSSQSFLTLLGDLGTTPASSWSIGNSLPSDVLPALECGMRAIWVEAHVWEYEHRGEAPLNGFLKASSLSELPGILSANRSPTK